VPSRLDELTEKARRTLARSQPSRPAQIGPENTMPALPTSTPLPTSPLPPGRARAPAGTSGSGEIILGIDPGTATMGYGLVRVRLGARGDSPGGYELVAYGTLTTPAGVPTERRLLTLYTGLRELMRTHRPSHAAVEQLFFGKNVTTAVTVGQARGVALLAAAEFGLSISEYKPAEIKFTVAGFGRAGKPQIQRMVQTLLNLDAIPRPDDAADALAVALCHLRHARVRALGFR